MGRDDAERCCFDDLVDHWADRARKAPTASKVTPPLLDALAEVGVRGRDVLDVGCGIGDVAIATIGLGAESARGYDLSPKAILEAQRLAVERGVGARTTFEVGDAAELVLPEADVVVLNRVVCCYPDIDGLLGRSIASARRVIAFTAPASSGFTGALNRFWTSVGNLGFRLRAKRYGGFRTFVHDLDDVDARLRSAGFEPRHRRRVRLVWDLALYERVAA